MTIGKGLRINVIHKIVLEMSMRNENKHLGHVQGQVEWGSEQPGLVEGVHAYGKGVGRR